MVHSTRLSRLTDDLVQAVTGLDLQSDRQAYKRARDLVIRGLRGQQHARTNPFHVTATFAGLDEKFRVNDRDDLADVLQECLSQLSQRSNKLNADVLSLLLQLSDRPLENTRIEALARLRPDSPPPPQTWTDILQEDPYSDDEIWKDIDYAAESSDDGRTPVNLVRPEPVYVNIDVEGPLDVEPYIVQTDLSMIKRLEGTQFWSVSTDNGGAKIGVSELHVIRETLFMLLGVSTSLYKIDKQRNDVRLNPAYVLSHVIPSTFDNLLAEFTFIGKDLLLLRQWKNRRSSQPLLQRFEFVIRNRLSVYEQSLSETQHRYLQFTKPVAVSALNLMHQIRTTSLPLVRLAHIVSDVGMEILNNPVRFLEALFDEIALAQANLEKDKYDFMLGIFFECLQTYLRPICRWMEEGELSSDTDAFFISESNANGDSSLLWHDRFALCRDTQGKIQAPNFLHPAANWIFNTGKSIVMLRELGIQDCHKIDSSSESRLESSCIQSDSDTVPLSPFAELFQLAFQDWISSKFSLAANVLRNQILDAHGLMQVLVGFETVYLGRNGAVFEDFASEIFERLDSEKKGWNDRYILTEVARRIFAPAMAHADRNKISIHSTATKGIAATSIPALGVVSIDFALPWLLQNIIQRPTIPVYQQAFTLLTQTFRAKYLLQRLRLVRLHALLVPTAKERLITKIRQNLTFFVDTLRSYLLSTAIFFTSQEMYVSMPTAQDMDEMAACHAQFAGRLQERMLLSDTCKVVRKAVIEVLNLCVSISRALNPPKISVGRNLTKRPIPCSNTEPIANDASGELRQHDSDNDSKESIESNQATPSAVQSANPTLNLHAVDEEYDRLRMFIITGLRSMARAGGEPMWEQLVERLQWEGKKT